jgi:hypothetical protein
MDFFSIPILATAISIIICWSLFAIFCSFIQEAIAQLKEERGRFMRKSIFKQLYDKPNGLNWGSLLYLHGTIDLLSKASDRPTSDIAPRLFAETLIEVVSKTHVVQMQKAALVSMNQLTFQNALLNDFKAATMVLKPSDVVTFFQQAYNSSAIHGMANGVPDEAAIYQNLVNQIESWYVEMTQRLSVWYKKKIRVMVFIIGVVLALIINVDSVQLFSHFNNNAASRTVMMNYYEANAERLNEQVRKTVDVVTLDSLKKRVESYNTEMQALIDEAALPVGWDYSYINTSSAQKGSFLWKLVGILTSGFAASFGAPFWFELLKKVYSRKPVKQ